MNICILTPRFPLPECGGDLLRINNIARYLKSKGHRLVLVSYTETGGYAEEEALKLYDKVYVARRSSWLSFLYSAIALLRQQPIQCGYYFSHRYDRLLKQVIAVERPNLYVSHLLRMVPFLEANHLQGSSIVEMTDALSKTYALSAHAKGHWLRRMIYRYEKRLIEQYEMYVLQRYPKVVLVSQSDIDILLTRFGSPQSPMVLHTNGVECVEQMSCPYDAHKICFIGHMQSLQNQDAVLYFVEEIFPLILNEEPAATFYVVGAHPPKNIQKLNNGRNVFVTGYVEDLYAATADSCVAVAPVRIAAGIQNKVLVAMGYGLPVVLTPLIAQSIPELVNGENCFISNEAASIAASCLKIMRNAHLRQQLAEKGAAVVRANYSWNEKLSGYESLPVRKEA